MLHDYISEQNFTAIVLSLISGLSTGLGGIFVALFGTPKERTVGFMLGFASGVMMYVSFFHLLPESIVKIGFWASQIYFVIGVLFFALVIHLIPEPDPSTLSSSSSSSSATTAAPAIDRRLWMTAIVVVTGISLHNFPEGMAVYLSSLKGWKLGVPIAIAIGLHNIPEGVAVACSMYAATKSSWSAIKWSLISGICEPIGAIAFGFFFYKYITEYAVYCMLAGVGGIMTLICLKELIPNSINYTSPSQTLISNICGMVLLYVCSQLMEYYE